MRAMSDASAATHRAATLASPRSPSVVAAVVLLVVLARAGGAYIPRFAQWVNGLGVLGPDRLHRSATPSRSWRSMPAFDPHPRRRGDLRHRPRRAVRVHRRGARLGGGVPDLALCRARRDRDAAWPATRASPPSIAPSARRGRKIVFLLRLSPVFPFTLLNYALGLTRVRFADYLIASFGMLPGTLLYVYYGKLAGDVAALAGGARSRRARTTTPCSFSASPPRCWSRCWSRARRARRCCERDGVGWVRQWARASRPAHWALIQSALPLVGVRDVRR